VGYSLLTAMSYEWIDEIISAWATDFRPTVYREGLVGK